MNDDRGYLPVFDEQVHSRQHYTSLPWWQWADNSSEMMGRCSHGGAYFLDIVAPAAMTEVCRFYYDATPEEEGVEVRVWSKDNAEINVSIVSSTTAGAALSTATYNDVRCTSPRLGAERFFSRRFDSLELSWPLGHYTTERAGRSDWLFLQHSAVLPTQQRLVMVGVQNSYVYGQPRIRAIEVAGRRGRP